MLAINKIIGLVIVSIVIVIMVILISNFYAKVLKPQEKLDFEQLPGSTRSIIQGASANFFSNLENCKNKTNSNCICKNVLTNFPKEVEINVDDLGAEPRYQYVIVSLAVGKTTVNSQKFENLSISNIIADGKTITDANPKFYQYNKISFENQPSFNGDKIISMDMYKTSGKLYFITCKKSWGACRTEAEQKAFFDKLQAC